MKIISTELKCYCLPLSRELTIKDLKIKKRRGVLLFLSDSDGNVGCGELSPLQSLHNESLEEAVRQLRGVKSELVGIEISDSFADFTDDIESLIGCSVFPSVANAIEMAMLDLFRQCGEFDSLGGGSIYVNALLSADAEDVCDLALKLVEDGFTLIKVKVGKSTLDRDILVVNKLAEIVKGKATLRLDSNRSWSLDVAVEFCKQVVSSLSQIEYIEEPLNNVNELTEFSELSPIQLALDETLVERDLDYLRQLGNIGAYILKPSLLGGFSATAKLIRYANENKITSVISAAFPTSVSLKAYSLFAAKMNLQGVRHGLDTLKFLAEDIVENSFVIKNGRVNLTQIIGNDNVFRQDRLEDI